MRVEETQKEREREIHNQNLIRKTGEEKQILFFSFSFFSFISAVLCMFYFFTFDDVNSAPTYSSLTTVCRVHHRSLCFLLIAT